MKQVHLIISGRVQGVFFRHNTNKIANKLGLNGFVRNLDDGNVEVIAEGQEKELEKLVEFCRVGPSGARVDDVQVEYSIAKGQHKGFSIK